MSLDADRAFKIE